MIVIGYPGIGKSTLAKGDNKYIDLESSSFFINGVRPNGWEILYCNVAEYLSRQGKVVFISSHKSVVDELASRNTRGHTVLTIYPDIELGDQWVEKLRHRCECTGLEKDMRAFDRAKEYFNSDIDDLRKCPFIKMRITNMSYCLECYIKEWEDNETGIIVI